MVQNSHYRSKSKAIKFRRSARYNQVLQSSLSPAGMAFSKRTFRKIALILGRNKRKKIKQSISVRNRQKKGEYSMLYYELVNDNVKFNTFFRIPYGKHTNTFSEIEIDLKMMTEKLKFIIFIKTLPHFIQNLKTQLSYLFVILTIYN